MLDETTIQKRTTRDLSGQLTFSDVVRVRLWGTGKGRAGMEPSQPCVGVMIPTVPPLHDPESN